MHSGADEKTILFISHDATRTGAPILLLNLARALSETKGNRYAVRFLIKRPGYEIADKFSVFNTKFATAPYGGVRKKLRLPGYSISNIKKSLEGVDVVISNTITNGDILPLIKKYYKGPLYSYVHELEIAAQSFTNATDVNALMECTDHYLVPSMAVKNFLQTRYSIAGDRISLLQYYIPASKNTATGERTGNTLVIGGVGTIDWRKGPDLFIQVARRTFQQNPDADIKFIWKGAVENIEFVRLKYDITKTGLQNKIEFQPSSDDMQSFYKNIDVFLLTSREDPYPLVVLEAAGAGTPTICFDNAGGAPEFLQASASGVRTDYLDIDAMAEAVIDYYNHREKRTAEGNAARNTLLRTHQDSSYITRQLDSIISSTCNNINTPN